MLPKMRATAKRFKTVLHLVVVISDTHYFAKFAGRNAHNGIMKALSGHEEYIETEP